MVFPFFAANGRPTNRLFITLSTALIFFAGPGITSSTAAENEYVLTLKDHAFVEDALQLPADTVFVLKVVNKDDSPEEFESHDLHVEKLVPGNHTITLRVGPLAPGSYAFVGEFHEDSAFGQLIVGAEQ